MQHTSKLPHVGTSIFAIMSQLAKTNQAIDLSQGFPDFEMDKNLVDLAVQAMQKGYNQYAPMPGVLELRLAISKKYELLYDTSYHPETEITVTAGATQAIFGVISTFIKKDNEVIIFKPAYDSYEPIVELNGGIPVSVELQAPDFKVDWTAVKKKITSRTKMIVINSPQNPIGTVFSESDMLELQKLTNDTDIMVLSDEVYEHIIFDGEKHQSACRFPGLKSRTFITASFGKTFHSTGWKLGYCCAPKALMEEFRKVHQFMVFCVNHPTQLAVAEYMATPEHYLELPTFYQRKRDFFLSLIESSGFIFTPSKGTYFQLLDYSNITDEHDEDFAKRLVQEHRLASIPISVFYNEPPPTKVLRFCFAKKEHTLEQAARILNSISS